MRAPERMRTPERGWRRTLCPYCGVGCGLLVEVRDGAVTRVKGDPDHPANFGDVCAKAVHLPPVLRTPDRLLYPQLRTRRDRERERVPWDAGAAPHGRAPARDRRRPRPGRRGVLRLRAAHDRGVLRRRQARQGLPRHQQLRHQLAPVHGLGGRRLRALAGRRRPARRLGGPRASRLLSADRHQHRRLPPDRLQAHPAPQAGSARRRHGHRGRSALDRRPPTSPTSTWRCARAPTSRSLNGMLHVLWREGLLDQRFIDEHTSGWDALRSGHRRTIRRRARRR